MLTEDVLLECVGAEPNDFGFSELVVCPWASVPAAAKVFEGMPVWIVEWLADWWIEVRVEVLMTVSKSTVTVLATVTCSVIVTFSVTVLCSGACCEPCEVWGCWLPSCV